MHNFAPDVQNTTQVLKSTKNLNILNMMRKCHLLISFHAMQSFPAFTTIMFQTLAGSLKHFGL